MKCQNCGQNEAVFFQHTNINGEISETQLCQECAEKLGVMKSLVTPMPRLLSEYFGMFGDSGPSPGRFAPFAGMLPRLRIAEPPAHLAPPPETVEAQGEIDGELKKKREINMLREQMKAAADAENFEKAMSLREEIRRLEA